MNKKQNSPANTATTNAEMTAMPGTTSTGASSHTDPSAPSKASSNPASDLDVRLKPTPANQESTAQSWISNVNQLPQEVKQWGSKAVAQINSLSTTQKVVGGALLAGGLGWLAYRAASGKKNDGYAYDAANSARPWGTTGRTTVEK